jgi:hypothetical protein
VIREEIRQQYQVCGGETTLLFDTYEEAYDEAVRQASAQARELARARGILGPLTVTVSEKRKTLDTESAYGVLSFDFGGEILAVAEAETSR